MGALRSEPEPERAGDDIAEVRGDLLLVESQLTMDHFRLDAMLDEADLLIQFAVSLW